MTINSTTSPLVILGFDGGDPDLILKWAKEGHLPTVAALMKQGCWGKTGGPELICEHGVWVSIMSGLSRREHGYHYFRQMNPGSYQLKTVTGTDLPVQPFWQALQGTDKRVLIVDVPDTLPIPGVAGVQLANWAVHDAPFPASTEPPGLLKDLQKRFGRPMVIHEQMESTVEVDRRLYQQLMARVKTKGDLCRHLLTQGSANKLYDLVAIVFAESHTGGHQFWQYRPDAQGQDSRHVKDLEHGIRNLYQAIDREMGLILQHLPDQANIFILSSVGLHDQYPTGGLIEDFCRKLGYQATPIADRTNPAPTDLLGWARKLIPQSWRVAVSRYFPRDVREQLLAQQFVNNTDWARTIAVDTQSTYTSFLRINLKGREPLGTVELGEDYNQVLTRLEADLAQLIDPKTGQPAVLRTTRTYDLFHHDILTSSMPDLFVEWQPVPHFLDRAIHPRAELSQPKPEFYRGSDHNRNGFLAAAGPDIPHQGALSETSLLDLVPTFQRLLGDRTKNLFYLSQ